MTAGEPVAAPQNHDYLTSITLYGAVGQCIEGGKLYMQASATSNEETKRFLVLLASKLRNPYGPRPYLVMDNHSSHHSDKVAEEMSRFKPTH